MAVEKWFTAGKKTGWRKNLPTNKRRSIVLRSRRGNPLKAARAMQALSNVTTDKRTEELAGQDAAYFYRIYNKRNI